MINLISINCGITLSLLSLIITFLFGILSITIVVKLTNITRRDNYNKIFNSAKSMSLQINAMRSHYEELKTDDRDYYISRLGNNFLISKLTLEQLKEKYDKAFRKLYLENYFKDWNNINMGIISTKGKMKKVPEYIRVLEDSYCSLFDEKTQNSLIRGIDKTIRYFDILLDFNNINGFGLLTKERGRVFTIQYKKNLLRFITGIKIIVDKKNVSKSYKIKSKKDIAKLIKKSQLNPNDYETKKLLYKEYKNHITIKHRNSKTKELEKVKNK